MSKSETAIVLKAGGRGMECISTVRLIPEAEKVVRRPAKGSPWPVVLACAAFAAALGKCERSIYCEINRNLCVQRTTDLIDPRSAVRAC